MSVALMNERTHERVAVSDEIAATRASRRRGLPGRDGLEQATAMLLAPCAAVHTAGGARAVIEMQGGSLGVGQVLPGDRLYLAPSQAGTGRTARVDRRQPD